MRAAVTSQGLAIPRSSRTGASIDVYRAFTTWLDGDEHVIDQDGKKFSDSGTVRDHQANHVVLVRHERIAGTFDGTRTLRGTHKTTIRVRRNGKLLDTCRSSIRFKARR